MATADTLSASLTNAAALIDKLAEVLEQERLALAEQQLERLKTLTQQKLELLAALERNTKTRLDYLKQQGVSADEAGFRRYLASLAEPIAKPLSELWKQVEQQLEACKAANTVNGKVIQRSRQQAHSLLQLMRGPDNVGSVYNQTGNTASLAGNYALAKA